MFAALVLMSALSARAQTLTPTPLLSSTPLLSPTPADTMPVAPIFNATPRPMPSADRVGVENDNQLSLTLSQAIEMALKNNNDIDASRNDVRISEFSLMGAQGVYDPLVTSENFYESLTTPTASAIGGAVNGAVTQKRLYGSAGVNGFSPFGGATYSSLFNASRSTTSNTNAFLNPQYPSSLEFGYTQPLWRNRSIDNNRRTIMIAKKNIDLSDSQLKLRAITTIYSVEQAYWDLAYAMRNLQVQLDTLKQAKEQLESNKRLVSHGVLAPIEIVAADAQISTYEQAVYAAQESITRAENTLKTLLLPDRASPEWSRPITPVTPVDIDIPRVGLDVALTQAMTNRPEIAQLDIRAGINRIDQRFYRNQTKPQIDLVTTYTTQGLAGTETPASINPMTGMHRVPPVLVGGLFTSLGNLAALRYPSYHVGLNISFPIGNRIAQANLGSSLIQGDKIANNRAQTEENVEAEVRNALQALRSAESRLESATAARVAAEELYESETRQFRAGTTTFYLVLQRQTELTAARGRELQARTDLNKAVSEFNRSTGRTLEANNVTVSK
jgi:HAE1 family hydrophobic/amphiphilic exporter-1